MKSHCFVYLPWHMTQKTCFQAGNRQAPHSHPTWLWPTCPGRHPVPGGEGSQLGKPDPTPALHGVCSVAWGAGPGFSGQ